MEPASPARLYACIAGALLIPLGLVGFFYDASFGGLDDLEPALGVLEVNAWFNLLYLLTGALGILFAGAASRTYALTMGLFFTLLAIVGWGSWGLHLTLGLLGLAAVAGTPKPKRGSSVRQKRTKEARKSKPGANPARNRA